MKKRLATIALVLCVMACCLWACASQPSGNGGAGGDAAQAVSYTHLDVYKRQPEHRAAVRLRVLDGKPDGRFQFLQLAHVVPSVVASHMRVRRDSRSLTGVLSHSCPGSSKTYASGYACSGSQGSAA